MAKVTTGTAMDVMTGRTSAVYRMELSAEEAETLAAVLGAVGGSTERSPRRHAAAVLNALRGAGVEYYDRPIQGLKTGGITFCDYPAPKLQFAPGHFRLKFNHKDITYFSSDPGAAWERVQIAEPGAVVIPPLNFTRPFGR